MKASKWYLVQGQTHSGNYALIKEEDTDLIVAEFPAVDHYTANVRAINLNSIVAEHNAALKLFEKAPGMLKVLKDLRDGDYPSIDGALWQSINDSIDGLA